MVGWIFFKIEKLKSIIKFVENPRNKMSLVPTKVFFVKGVGVHKERLGSFELALRDAGIHRCNLVNVSSIFPPKCKIINKDEGLKSLGPGQITYCVMARTDTNEPNRLIAAAVGLAVP